MTRAVLSAAIDTDWRQVSNERPCPVCGGDDACSIHLADDFACCAREPSDWKLTTGAWLHRVPRVRVSAVAHGLTVSANDVGTNGLDLRH